MTYMDTMRAKLGNAERYAVKIEAREVNILSEDDQKDIDRRSLRGMMNALQSIGQAVTTDNATAYRDAVSYARDIGATEEQITDAYTYRSGLRGQPVSFDVDGNPR